MSLRKPTLPLPWKRMLSAEEATDYCGFKTTKQFLDHARSRVPVVTFGNYERWDRHRLDEWLDALSGRRVSDAIDSDADIIAAAFKSGKARIKRGEESQ